MTLNKHTLNVANAFQAACGGPSSLAAPQVNGRQADAIACAALNCAQVARSLAELGMARVLFQMLSNSQLDSPGYQAYQRVKAELDAAETRLTPPPEPTMTEWWIQYRSDAAAGWANMTCHNTYADAYRDLAGAKFRDRYRIIGVTQP